MIISWLGVGEFVFRWVLFTVGLLLSVIGLGLLLWASFALHHFSSREITPLAVEADLSGREMRIEFTAAHTGAYNLRLVMKLPAGRSLAAEQRYRCILRSPNAKPVVLEIANPDRVELDCRTTPGQLRASWAVLGGRWKVQNSDNDFDDVIPGEEDGRAQIERYLGSISTEAGQHYILRARIKSDDATIRTLRPWLEAQIAGMWESIAVTNAITALSWVVGIVLLLLGIPIIVFKRPWKAVS